MQLRKTNIQQRLYNADIAELSLAVEQLPSKEIILLEKNTKLNENGRKKEIRKHNKIHHYSCRKAPKERK
ncbi:uncharacterized protein MELLADRAFT_57468 [Melampsora larici-populina 98AG31]|uniref:Uncharacterized protein n=1 Tax=Melampsora larici-populina (strain 98AG31 / pathotype 3-4-7) TaxID=747676 RepID=F4S2V3_MELLP|nr:uncharacterized protein MELLADRAFT_57468 [Melampsora larici-populina 98AG31]EGG01007.1 hypothetical protein MELLADRAFT_57468 [Melampsora larici-populina 98AG31]